MTDEPSAAEKTTIAAGQNDGLQQVIAQLTKNLIDGTMNATRYRMQVAEALTRLRAVRE